MELKGTKDDGVREAAKKKTFFLGDLSQMCLPTHPPQGFCEIWEYGTEGEIRVKKGDIWGDLGGF